ncbi:UNVERIFIED_CONTAM: hypothetical protein Slati_2688700 [Sesamum latifolium]|uniref:Uncharacterized protein n=1 Tax=Sesamum latifolium TaxID=2727402 RepID=A0AAW2VX39_9LAMI
MISHETVVCSDHSVIWIDLEGKLPQQNTRWKQQFRFEFAWTTTPDCADVIKQAWSSTGDNFLSTTSLIEKIRSTRVQFSQWNKDNFENIRHEAKELTEKINGLQQGRITNEVRAKVDILRDSLEKLGATARQSSLVEGRGSQH